MPQNLPEESVKQPLQTLNDTWMQGEFPAEWKRSVVQLTPKAGKLPDKMTNLRPI